MKNFKINKTILVLSICFLQFTVFSQAAFSPQNIAGLKLWVMADSSKSTTNPFIDTLYDQSGNTNHLYQTNLTYKPQYSGTLLNGHKTVLFDGIDDYLQFIEISDIRTVFWVIKENNTTTNFYRPLLGHNIEYDFYRASSKIWDAGNAHSKVRNGVTKLNSIITDGTTTDIPPNAFSLISLVTTGNVIAKSLSIDRNITDRVWSGEVAELIIYNTALTPFEVDQVEDYLNNKYTTPITLPTDISVLNSFCDTVITASGTFNNYTWSTGATTPTISVNKSGKYWVKATSIFGRVSADTILVNFPDYHKPVKNYICSGSSLVWDTDLPKSDYTFQWQDNTTTDSVFTINQAGNYFVKITDSFGCSVTTETVVITEDNFSTTTSLGPNQLCSGNAITLTSGASATNSYTWNNGSNNDSLIIINSGQYSVIVTNTNNCVAKDTINVTVIGLAPVANFSTSAGCQNSVVLFTNLSVPPAGETIASSFWDFGDTQTSGLFSPFHIYSDTGFYSVKIVVTTTAGCEQSFRKTIHIAPTPTVNFSSSVACQNDSTSFSNQSISSAGYSITAIHWNFGDPASSANTSTAQLPKHLFANQATYPVKLIAINNVGCKDSLIKAITVNGQVSANFSYGPACLNSPTIFQDNSIVPSSPQYARNWNFSGTAATGTLVSRTFTNTGVYSVTLTLAGIASGTNTCSSRIIKQVNVFFPPAVSFTSSPFCSKDTIALTNSSTAQSGIISSYNWKLNNTSFSATQNPTLTAANAGTYPLKLIVTNSFGCKDSATNQITVLPLPSVTFSTNPSPYLYVNSPVNFIPNITNGNSYNWIISNTGTYPVQSPTVSFNNTGTYTVTLTLKDDQNCQNFKTSTITVLNRYLDLAILEVKPEKTSANYMTVKTDLANFGSIPITNFDINYTVNNGGNIIETWNGILNPGNIINYNFTAKTFLSSNDVDNITCVTIQSVNFINDENTANNNFCKALNTGNISVLDPYPNPSDGDITLPVILDKDTDYNIEITNSLGQIISEETIQTGIAGLNLITVYTSRYVRGCYFLKITINDKTYIKKFLKTIN